MTIEKSVIEGIKRNIFDRSIDSIEDYQKFDWHKNGKNIDTNQANSSQALAIDFWGCLKLSKYKNQLINKLFDKNEKNWFINFEYEDKSLLSEKKATQVDILIESENCVLVIESKFTEKEGGRCSQTNKDKNGVYQCNGKYEKQTNPRNNNIESQCALTGKGIKYWEFIDELTYYKKNETYDPCPFKGGEYQWMRNICFAEAYAKKYNVDSESYLVYLDSEKCSVSNKVKKGTYLGKLKGMIKDEKAFAPRSYNELISKCISYLESDTEEKNIWIDLEKWIINKEKQI
jgi:hypothetical protein